MDLKICEECLKELSPKDQPYKCFNKGMNRGREDSIKEIHELKSELRAYERAIERIRGELQSKLNAVTEEEIKVAPHYLTALYIVNKEIELRKDLEEKKW